MFYFQVYVNFVENLQPLNQYSQLILLTILPLDSSVPHSPIPLQHHQLVAVNLARHRSPLAQPPLHLNIQILASNTGFFDLDHSSVSVRTHFSAFHTFGPLCDLLP